MNCAVVFGGTGSIGVFFAKYLLENKKADKVYLFSLEDVSNKKSSYR